MQNIDVIPAQAGIHFSFLFLKAGKARIAFMNTRQPAIYIMASAPRGTLYIGVTGWLRHRVWEHREGLVEGFTKTYEVKHLAWFELFADFPFAIRRETQLKKWNRAWKLELIEDRNPHWRDLWIELND